MSPSDFSKLIHDMNSDLSALSQALDVIAANYRENADDLDEIIPLSVKKVEQLLETWNMVKSQINNR